MGKMMGSEVLIQRAVLFLGITMILFIFSLVTFLIGDKPSLLMGVISFIASILPLSISVHYTKKAEKTASVERLRDEAAQKIREKRLEPFGR
jgi:hypothetical protein